MIPDDRKYSKDHEWVLLESEGQALVGITSYAQEELGDVVYLSLPEVGTKVQQFAKFGEVESVKAISDLISPISGEVVAVNETVTKHPEIVNQDPYGKGWLIRIAVKDVDELQKLMTAQEYEAMIASGK